MTEKDKLPEEYLNGFNTGFRFSVEFPGPTKKLMDANINREEDKNSLNVIQGLWHGISQGERMRKFGKNNVDREVLEEIQRARDETSDPHHDLEL